MADDALLGDLCSICNTAKFKYRCPGCSARTCSLPCYKRHQQWAQCNGKRDPTKYMKRSELATPSGIDHDYNFLTGIERSLEKAERQAEGRALGNLSDPRRDSQVRQPTDQNFAAAGVTVIRAPKGLSRQKENKTHRSKKGYLVWTVEWLQQDKTRIVTESSSGSTILHAQPFKSSSKSIKKRKRDVEQPVGTSGVSEDVPPTVQLQDSTSQHEENNAQAEFPPPEQSRPEPANQDGSHGDETTRGAPTTEDPANVANDSHGSVLVPGTGPEPASDRYSFYLLKPRTSSNRHVLIPLEPTATLAECLRGRTVLEFPAIYVFPISVVPPSEQFMLEAQYLQQEGEEQKELEDLIKNVSPQTLRHLNEQSSKDNAGEEIDSEKILDVLKQDIGSGQ